ncbi:MAG: hypothetical protein HY956_07605 [Deltaproteobacteria bacterium]|nr:hypothetical protein [Deltaproteobacteria bacterium]
MATEISEKIKVMAVFEKGVRPVKFKWRGRVYPVKEITYTWTSKEGEAPILHFSVTDGATLFELAYNQKELEWTLNGVDA